MSRTPEIDPILPHFRAIFAIGDGGDPEAALGHAVHVGGYVDFYWSVVLRRYMADIGYPVSPANNAPNLAGLRAMIRDDPKIPLNGPDPALDLLKAAVTESVELLAHAENDYRSTISTLPTASVTIAGESVAAGQRLRGIILLSLQRRVCTIGQEIVLLAENAFPDGALSRARTLYEAHVIMAVIAADHECILSDRLHAASSFEYKRLVEHFDRDADRYHDWNQLEDNERDKLRRMIAGYEQTFGTRLSQPYEWARPLFPDLQRRITFADVEGSLEGVNEFIALYHGLHSSVHITPRSLIATYFDTGSLGETPNEGYQDAQVKEACDLATYKLIETTWMLGRALATIAQDFDGLYRFGRMLFLQEVHQSL